MKMKWRQSLAHLTLHCSLTANRNMQKKYPLTPSVPPQCNSPCKAAQLKLQYSQALSDRAVSTGVPIITQAGHMHNFFPTIVWNYLNLQIMPVYAQKVNFKGCHFIISRVEF